MSCDLCGKTVTKLVELRDIYKSNKLKMICEKCEKIVNDKLIELKAKAHERTTKEFRTWMKGKQR